MATLPQASVSLSEASNALGSGTGYAVVLACVSQNADLVPRVVSSTQALLDQYNYAPGVDYCALHFAKTRKPIIFVGLPIVTAGVIGSRNNVGVTGTCNVSVAAAASGVLEQVAGVVTCTQGALVGTDQIVFTLSLDGGQSSQIVRLGQNTSYTVPYVGLVLTFEAGGTFNPGDVFSFATTAPMWGSTAMSAARTALAGQQNLARSWLVVGDLPNSTFAGYVTTEANNYETANERFTYARASVTDRLPLATKAQLTHKMTGAPSITFAATGHTITRATGSFVTDGFLVGQIVSVSGSVGNTGTIGALTAVSATVLTFASGVVDEGPDATGVVISASESLVFAASGHTATRSSGSWTDDGFAVGQSVTFSGTASNNATVVIASLSATVLTAASGIVNETIASSLAAAVQSLTVTAWVSAQSAAFATVDAQKRIDLSLGRASVQSPITGYLMRRPAAWAASIREYQHDLQIPCWRKADGPLDGFEITDDNGNTVEFDERFDGGGLAARFTCLRSYSNGPLGAFVALSLTRDSDGALLSRTHNLAVADLACTVVQTETENAIGQVLVLKADGTGTDASLSLIEGRVNTSLQVNLLQRFNEGPRASSAVWTASRTDVLNTAGATLNGVLALELNGTLENINTTVQVS